MPRDIARDTLNVGNALANVRIDQMILNLAKGIAWGQYELDKVGIDITKMMGAPGTVSIGGENLSMLEAGFTPSFYHFVDTILELKMEVNIREEELKETKLKDQKSGSQLYTLNVENTTKAKGSFQYGPFGASVEQELKVGVGYKNESAYLRSLDTTHSQKFSQDLSASSLMRTKLVPIPPPDLLLERIRILLDKIRKDAEDKEADQIMFYLDSSFVEILDKAAKPDAEALASITAAFNEKKDEGAADFDIKKVEQLREGRSWTIKADDKDYFAEYDQVRGEVKVFKTSQDDVKTKDASLASGFVNSVIGDVMDLSSFTID